MSIVRLDLAYDGTGFHGWAVQPRQRTVEGEISDVLTQILGSAPKLSVAGRTDTGVHARGQVVSFAAGLDPAKIAAAINSMLGPEVVVLRAAPAPEGFDARRSAVAREYRYRIDLGPVADPFSARFVWHRPKELALTPMRAAAKRLLGRHDFASFARAPADGRGTVRRLERLSISRRGDRVEIAVRANAFAHQMVRSLVGTLVAVGEGRLKPSDMARILRAKDRSAAWHIAPAGGLTLERVYYG
ncbi:MAG: tRNA pseudouridine(38-40) synthase TruA [Actinomycetota bacterium]